MALSAVDRLAIEFMAVIIVPPGSGKDSMQLAVQAIVAPDRLQRVAAEGHARAMQAIAAVRAAPDNPYGTEDEAIAAAILQQIDARKAQQAQQAQHG